MESYLKQTDTTDCFVRFGSLETDRGCCSGTSPPACCPGRNTPWPGSGTPAHTPWRPPGPWPLARSLLWPPRTGCSQTSSPPAEHCTCHRGSTVSHSEGTSECSCTCPSSCSFLMDTHENSYRVFMSPGKLFYFIVLYCTPVDHRGI